MTRLRTSRACAWTAGHAAHVSDAGRPRSPPRLHARCRARTDVGLRARATRRRPSAPGRSASRRAPARRCGHPGQVRVAPGTTTSVTVKVDNTLAHVPGDRHLDARRVRPVWPPRRRRHCHRRGRGGDDDRPSAWPRPGDGHRLLPGRGAGERVERRGAADHSTPGHRRGARRFIPTAYVTDYSDKTLTPVDIRTGNAGPAIPVGSGPDGEVVTPDGKACSWRTTTRTT